MTAKMANALTVYHLARLVAGASDADLGVIQAAWPGCPHDDREALTSWLAAHPDLAEAVTKTDPEGPPSEGSPLSLLTADQILATEWPEPVWAVPGILPAGLTILAGRPKVGKSWLGLQIALSVASGGIVLGERVEKGPVLYLALEDTPRRLKDRMRKQGWQAGLPAEFMPLGQFAEQVGDLRRGGGEKLALQIERRQYRLVIVDTLSRSVYGDQNDVESMTLALTPIQEMALSLNTAVVMVDHHRKGFGTDPDAVADILGSTAKGAMADCLLGLYRESGKSVAILAVVGRDVEERRLALKMDGLTGCWQLEGDADELKMTENRQAILETLETLGPSALKEVVKAVDRNKGSVYRDLQDLVSAGLVRQTDGRYRVPDA